MPNVSNVPNLVPGADAAFATNIPHTGIQVVFGYMGGPQAYRKWTLQEWLMFPGCKVPIWVGGYNGEQEALAMVDLLHAHNVPPNTITALDMEKRVDEQYVSMYGAVMAAHQYKTWVYGSESTVFFNPVLQGYWLAEWGGDPAKLVHASVRAVQDRGNIPPGYDLSFVHAWTTSEMWTGD